MWADRTALLYLMDEAKLTGTVGRIKSILVNLRAKKKDTALHFSAAVEYKYCGKENDSQGSEG